MDPAANNVPRGSKRPWRALALWAVGGFLLLNIALAASDKGLLWHKHSSKAHSKNGGVLYQACDSALEELDKGSPGIVLMGSSLMMAPVWSTDSKRFPQVEDFYHHHRCLGLEHRLSGEGLNHPKVTSLALPGAMVSDGYLIVDKLFKGDKKPELIVYGLAPRDFMDDLLTGETRTVVFQELMDLSDFPVLGKLYLPTWQEKTDFALNNAFFMYGKRWRYQDKLAAVYEKFVASCRADAGTKAPPAEQGFLCSSDRAATWSKSVQEYRSRYQHFNQPQFEKQSQFLRLLLQVAQQRGIPIVLVKMPLTKDNLDLMNSGLYKRYTDTVALAARDYGCAVVDMQSDPDFRIDDFYDTVHLNSDGGNKFLDKLAAVVKGRQPL